jgi:hypothetical protein
VKDTDPSPNAEVDDPEATAVAEGEYNGDSEEHEESQKMDAAPSVLLPVSMINLRGWFDVPSNTSVLKSMALHAERLKTEGCPEDDEKRFGVFSLLFGDVILYNPSIRRFKGETIGNVP